MKKEYKKKLPTKQLQICKFCNKEYEWDGIKRYPKGQTLGFSFEKYCSKECSKNDKEQNRLSTNLSKFGGKAPLSSKEIQEQSKQTRLRLYGSETYNNQEKRKQSLLESYGSESYNNFEQTKQTNLKKYGVENPLQDEKIKEKMKETYIEKYGNIGFAVKSIKKKSQQTRKEKYTNKNYTNRAKAKQTHIEKYNGVALGSPIIKAKHIKGLQEKYGVNWITQTEQFKKLWDNKEWVNTLLNKQYESKRKNKSFNISKKEEEIYKLLLEKFPNIIRQYKSDVYPFNCDFYIPELDLYIEYQGWWHHGNEPFDSNNIEHQKQIQRWLKKNKKQYLSAIKIWTVSDPLKRKTAKDNGLNWIEFFNLKQFNDWFLELFWFFRQ